MPNYLRFVVTGAAVGLVLGVLVSVLSDDAPSYGQSTELGYLAVLGAGLGALLAGLLAVLLDRRP